MWKSLILVVLTGCGRSEEGTLPADVFGDTSAVCDPAGSALPGAGGAMPATSSPLCRLAATSVAAGPPSDTPRLGLAYRCVGGARGSTELAGALSGMVAIGRPVLLGRDGTVSRLTGDERLLQAKQSVASCIEHGCTELHLPGAVEKDPVVGALAFARGTVDGTGFWLAFDPGPNGTGCTRMMVFPDVPVARDREPETVSVRRQR